MEQQTGKEWNKDEAINATTLKVEVMPNGSEVWTYDGKQLVKSESGQGLIEIAVILFIFALLAYAINFILDGNMSAVESLCKLTNNCGF